MTDFSQVEQAAYHDSIRAQIGGAGDMIAALSAQVAALKAENAELKAAAEAAKPKEGANGT